MGVDVLRTYEPTRIIFSSELKTRTNMRGHESRSIKRKSVLEAWERVVSTSGMSGSDNLFGQINAFFR